ncbi:MAG TPA: nucleotide exchange factor GrpE [Methylophilaceae bacterium]|nr:nucleotide exchange factor GrpE [Methylophilaceae bacterium]
MQQEDQTPQESAEEQAATPAENMDSTPSLEEMLQQAERKAQEHYDAWMYAKAEGENIRRRAMDDIDKARKFAIEKFSGELLAVMDSLQAATSVENATLESYRDGVELTLKQLSSAFEKFNLFEINPLGEKFDPNWHQAISAVESDAEPNTVVTVLQKGYRLNERVLRPALVMVAKNKD